ncbi:MAG: hypothetical protein EXR08_10980 [Alphaproteobacteria bacterium]|nr:hypothetical protein [Alphaproteobacteria bacterium]
MSISENKGNYILKPNKLSMAYSSFAVGNSQTKDIVVSASEEALTHRPHEVRTLEESLFDNRAALKIITSKLGTSHIDPSLRSQLFFQIDWLLKSEEWEEGDNLPNEQSFKTLIKFILNSSPLESPSLGLSESGNLLALWINGVNKLNLECFPNDHFKWLVSCVFEGKKERAAGESPSLVRLLNSLEPYNNAGWFKPI